MKTKFLAIVAILTIGFTSCKGEKKTENAEAAAETSVPAKNNFNVEVDAVVTKKDDFAIYYTEDGTDKFTPEQATWRGIAGTGAVEKVIFDLPEEIVPTLIRLDFGMNKEQGDVVIHNVKISYYQNSFEIKGSDFFNYFIKSEQFPTTVDPAKGTMTVLKATKEFSTPYFYPRQELIDKLATITAGK